jgi:hypothetical protein
LDERGAGTTAAPRLAASESNRAIPAYQAGPVDRLGRGQQKVRVSNPSAETPHPLATEPNP